MASEQATAPDGTPFHERKRSDSDFEPDMRITEWDARNATARYVNRRFASGAYRRAKLRLLQAVHAINRRELRSSARAFDGMM